MPITIFPPPPQTVVVSVSPLPINAAIENNGQLQRLADLMEAALVELRTLNAVTASLAQPVPEDPDAIRTDLNASLQ